MIITYVLLQVLICSYARTALHTLYVCVHEGIKIIYHSIHAQYVQMFSHFSKYFRFQFRFLVDKNDQCKLNGANKSTEINALMVVANHTAILQFIREKNYKNYSLRLIPFHYDFQRNRSSFNSKLNRAKIINLVFFLFLWNFLFWIGRFIVNTLNMFRSLETRWNTQNVW